MPFMPDPSVHSGLYVLKQEVAGVLLAIKQSGVAQSRPVASGLADIRWCMLAGLATLPLHRACTALCAEPIHSHTEPSMPPSPQRTSSIPYTSEQNTLKIKHI